MKTQIGYGQLSTFKAGMLHPIGMIECLPGDIIRMNTTIMLKAMPLVRPLMHGVDFRLKSFFVPNRLLWDEWEAFRNEEAGTTFPTVTVPADPTTAPLVDALGGFAVANDTLSALPIRAYNKVVNEKFYDKWDVITPRAEDDMTIARGLWQNDYFTTVRAEPQLGAEAEIPLAFTSTSIPVHGIGFDQSPQIASRTFRESGANTVTANSAISSLDNFLIEEDPNNAGYPGVNILLDEIAQASSISISDLRRAVKQQKWSELRNRIGDEYVDWLKALGVNAGDMRLREPEYLGGGSRRMSFSEILSTAETDTGTLGDVAGHGSGFLKHKPYTYHCKEDGFIVVLVQIVPKTVYTNAQAKMFLRQAETDFWSPKREGIGDQIITNREVYAASADPDGIFGYQDRHADYMRGFDRVTGAFREGVEFPAWHWARMFASEPSYNENFLLCDPSDRVFADQTGADHFLTQSFHDCSARRLISNRTVL